MLDSVLFFLRGGRRGPPAGCQGLFWTILGLSGAVRRPLEASGWPLRLRYFTQHPLTLARHFFGGLRGRTVRSAVPVRLRTWDVGRLSCAAH